MYVVNPIPILASVVVFGLITSYTDIKYGKIKNVHVILLIVTGLLLNVFYTGLLLNPSLSLKSDFIQTITNMILSLSVGFGLWMAGLIPAADAKLFFGYSALIPVFIYKHGYISYFPSLVLLINSVIPIAIFYIATSLINVNLKHLKKEMKEALSFKPLSKTIIFIFGFYFIFQLIFSYLNFRPGIFIYSIALFVAMELANKIKPTYFYILCAALSIFRILFFYNTILSLAFLENFLAMIFIFVFLRLLISSLVEFSFTKRVKIKDLRPGMMLGEDLVREKSGFVKEKSTLFTIFDIFRSVKQSLISDVCQFLTEKDIQKLRQLQTRGKLKFKTVKIANTAPFAPFMLMGVLLTFLLQGSLLHYLPLANMLILNLIFKK